MMTFLSAGISGNDFSRFGLFCNLDVIDAGLPNDGNKCLLINMSMAIAEAAVPNVQAQARDLTKRQMQQWFDWMDGILDVHRANFVFRQPTPAQMQEHKSVLKLAIRYCLWIYPLVADPEFNDPDLVSRLQVRTRQLQDAYDTFYDPLLSDEQAEKVLSRVFPE